MCGVKSKTSLLGLALLLLLSQALYSEPSYKGPDLPTEWYPIHETELTELETTLNEQSETIEQQSERLTALSTTIERQRSRLNALNKIIERQQTTIGELETSLDEYESEATARRIKVGAISFGVGLAAGGIGALVFMLSR